MRKNNLNFMYQVFLLNRDSPQIEPMGPALEHFPGQAQTFSLSYRNIQECSHRLRGSRD